MCDMPDWANPEPAAVNVDAASTSMGKGVCPDRTIARKGEQRRVHGWRRLKHRIHGDRAATDGRGEWGNK